MTDKAAGWCAPVDVMCLCGKPWAPAGHGPGHCFEAALRLHMICTRCGRDACTGDCGTAHRVGTALLQLRIGEPHV